MHVPMMECQPPTSLRFAMCANVRGWCMTHDFLKTTPKKGIFVTATEVTVFLHSSLPLAST